MIKDTDNGSEGNLKSEISNLKSATPAAQPAAWDETVRAALAEYRQKSGLTLAELGDELGVGTTQVSKYLSGKPHWDVRPLEAVAVDVMRTADRRRLAKVELFETVPAQMVRATCESMREVNCVGLVTGPAGIGKTEGINLYLAENKSAVLVTCSQVHRTPGKMVDLLFVEAGHRSKTFTESKADYLLKKFSGSNRLIIVDMAQRLAVSGLNFWFDFHDRTGCPIVLVGNPAVLELIRQSDQPLSRVGLHTKIAPYRHPEKVAAQLIKQLIPEAVDDLEELGTQVVRQQGHLRSLRMQCELARRIRHGNGAKWTEAFAQAHTQLVRDYELKR
jgi:DNA transposition AAA+ family ATPase